MWIVMTSSAKMPRSCWGIYRNIALVQLTQHATAWGEMPGRIDARDKRVHNVVWLGAFNVGKTARCAYERNLARAKTQALNWNSTDPIDGYMSWGGSA